MNRLHIYAGHGLYCSQFNLKLAAQALTVTALSPGAQGSQGPGSRGPPGRGPPGRRGPRPIIKKLLKKHSTMVENCIEKT